MKHSSCYEHSLYPILGIYLIGRLLKLGSSQSYFSAQASIYIEVTELVVIAL